MHYPLLRSSWSLAAGSLGLLVALLVCARPVPAQQKPAKELSTQQYASQLEKEMQEAEDSDAPTRRIVRLFKSWLGLVLLAMVIAPIVIAFKMTMWVIARMSATTDPEKLAMSDPWIRAHLAQQQAEGQTPPTSDP